MTLDDYKLWTGETLAVSDEQFDKLVAVASGRIASFLCLNTLPDPLPDDLAMVLANFIAAAQNHQGKDMFVTDKKVRNFTISFASNAASNAFKQIARQYGDIIGKYENCEDSMSVEGNRRCCHGCF